jgi:hypothetical protein
MVAYSESGAGVNEKVLCEMTTSRFVNRSRLRVSWGGEFIGCFVGLGFSGHRSAVARLAWLLVGVCFDDFSLPLSFRRIFGGGISCAR